MDEIREILGSVNNCQKSTSFEFAYGKGSKEQHEKRKKEIERALIRLSHCGLIEDYTTNYSAKTFSVTFREFNFIDSSEKLKKYVRKVQPSQIKSLTFFLDEISSRDFREQPYFICEWLIQFTYNSIERSRRRMMLETVEMARGGYSNNAIKERLLNYLQEGQHAERINKLAEEEDIVFDNWINLTDDIANRTEAKELRGDVSRSLETYPEHSGLLVVRSVSEALSGDGSKVIIKENLKAAVQHSVKKYHISMDEINSLFVSLIERSTQGLKEIVEPILEILLEKQNDGSLVLNNEIINVIEKNLDGWDETTKANALQVSSLLVTRKLLPSLSAQVTNVNNALRVFEGNLK